MIFIIIILTIYLGLVATIKKKELEKKIIRSNPNEIKYCLGSIILIFLLEFVALEYIFHNMLHNYYLVVYLLFLWFLHKKFFSKALIYCGVQIYYHYRYIDDNYKLYHFDDGRKKIRHKFMAINTKMLVKFNINLSVLVNELYCFLVFKMDQGYDGLYIVANT